MAERKCIYPRCPRKLKDSEHLLCPYHAQRTEEIVAGTGKVVVVLGTVAFTLGIAIIKLTGGNKNKQ